MIFTLMMTPSIFTYRNCLGFCLVKRILEFLAHISMGLPAFIS